MILYLIHRLPFPGMVKAFAERISRLRLLMSRHNPDSP